MCKSFVRIRNLCTKTSLKVYEIKNSKFLSAIVDEGATRVNYHA